MNITQLDPEVNETESSFLIRMAEIVRGGGLFNLPDHFYHKGVAVSRSELLNVMRSPQYFKFKKEQLIAEETPAMYFGSAVHRAFLEPEIFRHEYTVAPKCDKRTKVGRAIWSVFQNENEGKKILKMEDMTLISSIRSALKSHQIVEGLFRGGQTEVSAYGNLDGVFCRARCDYMKADHGMLVDLKTTQDARPDEFIRSAYKYKYHIQAAYYLDMFTLVTGIKFDKFVFACVESTGDHGVQVYVADPDFIKRGREEYQKGLQIYRKCLKTNQWPGYEQQILNLTLPRWA